MLPLRHLRLGFFGLLVFLGFGLLLEALHGFKVGFYLDVASEPRRLAWRLAHAHGTLLSLLHIAFGLTLGSRYAPPRDAAERASRWLTAATVLLPGGFLLGGLFIHGGDPGLGILLVPFGAGALFAAVWITARHLGVAEPATGGALGGTSAPASAATGVRPAAPAQPVLDLRPIAFGSAEYDASVALRVRVLREPFGIELDPREREGEASLRHLGAFEGTRLVGCLMLEDLGDGRVKMRQVAIDFDRQRGGIGTSLVRYSETVAREAGYRRLVLHARQTAIPFYERLGYTAYGAPFVEVTLPHLGMQKDL